MRISTKLLLRRNGILISIKLLGDGVGPGPGAEKRIGLIEIKARIDP